MSNSLFDRNGVGSHFEGISLCNRTVFLLVQYTICFMLGIFRCRTFSSTEMGSGPISREIRFAIALCFYWYNIQSVLSLEFSGVELLVRPKWVGSHFEGNSLCNRTVFLLVQYNYCNYTICSGWKTSSNFSAVRNPSATQASLSEIFSLYAFFAVFAAFS